MTHPILDAFLDRLLACGYQATDEEAQRLLVEVLRLVRHPGAVVEQAVYGNDGRWTWWQAGIDALTREIEAA